VRDDIHCRDLSDTNEQRTVKIYVHLIDETTAEITFVPSWLARKVLRRRVRRGRVKRYGGYNYEPVRWRWETTNQEVPSAICDLIACPPVDELPRAVLEGRS